MTCIVGLIDGGRVLMGGDSCGSDGWEMQTRKDVKVHRVGDFVLGYTSSFRMGQLLAYRFTPPKRHPDTEPMRYMVTVFVESLRETMRSGGWLKTENGREEGGCFLVGYEGRLFQVNSDLQVGESAAGYDAVGSGAMVALGVMHATVGKPPADRLRMALEAAEKHCVGVRGPFTFLEIGD